MFEIFNGTAILLCEFAQEDLIDGEVWVRRIPDKQNREEFSFLLGIIGIADDLVAAKGITEIHFHLSLTLEELRDGRCLVECLECRFETLVLHISVQDLLFREDVDFLDDPKQGHNTLQIVGILVQRNTRNEELTNVNRVVDLTHV